ncbi:MAG: DUF58 domain-containing protein, partial [Halobacteriales archaeon]
MNEGGRRLAAAVGVATLAGGIAALLGTRGAGDSGMMALLSVAGGLVGAGMTVAVFRDWLPDPGIDPPAVERALEQPAPGDDFDR